MQVEQKSVIYQGWGGIGRSGSGQVKKQGTSLRNNAGNSNLRHTHNLADSVCNAGASGLMKKVC